jgi:bacillopeptidase F
MISRYVNAFLLVVLIATLSLGVASANVNKYSEGVTEVTRYASSTDKISVIVHLTDQVDLQTLDDRLFMRTTRQQRHKIVIEELQAAAARSQVPVREALDQMVQAGEVEGYTAYWITNCFVVYGTKGAVEQLSERADVDYIELNFRAELVEPIRERRNPVDSDANTPPVGVVAIRAPQVWYELGITGAGAIVGDLDTGCDGTHPALAARWRGNFAPVAECWRAPYSGSPTPTDGNGHGTHTCGTMVGACQSGTFDTTGVAPAALWIADDAISGSIGPTLDNNITDAFQWMADPDGNPNTINDVPDVVNNSWGVYSGFSGYSDCDARWNNVILACEVAGVVCNFSAGNEGPGAQTHRSPANAAIDSVSFFSVGAVDASGSWPYPIASFSSRGPSDCNVSIIKPEVSAPGVNVYSSVPGGGYDGTYDGTSMAGPHIGGLVALMRSANPNAEVRVIKSIIMRTARDLGTAGEDNTFGFGFIDAYAAVSQIITGQFGRVMGIVRNASTNAPIQALVQVVGGPQSSQADGSGNYSLILPGDSTYTLRYSLYGYTSQDISVNVVTDDTTFQNVNLQPRPIVYLLNENFETGAPNWTHNSAGGSWLDQWHISTERAMNGTHSYKCGDTGTGNYANLLDARLMSPTLNNLPAEARLSFYFQIQAERSTAYNDSAYDGGILEISVNGGAFTQVTPTPTYNKTFRYTSGSGNPVTGPMPGLRCWSDSIVTWTREELDLSTYTGSNVQFRWRFGSDAGTGKEGWYVDSVVVTAFGSAAPIVPLGLVIYVSGTDVVLTWADDSNVGYKIFSDIVPDGSYATLEGTTSGNTFTIVGGAAILDKKFYQVVGWDGN